MLDLRSVLQVVSRDSYLTTFVKYSWRFELHQLSEYSIKLTSSGLHSVFKESVLSEKNHLFIEFTGAHLVTALQQNNKLQLIINNIVNSQQQSKWSANSRMDPHM